MGSFFEDFAKIFPEQQSKKGPTKLWAGKDLSESKTGRSVMDEPIKLKPSRTEEIEQEQAFKGAGLPTIGVGDLQFGISDFFTPGGFAKLGAAIGKGAMLVGAMSPKTFLQKNPEFANTIFKDAEGNIKELYHGTSKDKDFKVFAVNKRGNFVGESPKQASDYALENDSMGYNNDWGKLTPKNTASQVKPLYVNVQSPYYPEGEELAKYVRSNNYAKAQRELMDKAKALGHDAVIYPDGGIAVASPRQIKSSLTGD